MIETLGTLLVGIIIGAIASAGLLVWWDRRRMDEAEADAARKSSGGKGEE
jgi:uncharacterized iron-regulated membrane protein